MYLPATNNYVERELHGPLNDGRNMLEQMSQNACCVLNEPRTDWELFVKLDYTCTIGRSRSLLLFLFCIIAATSLAALRPAKTHQKSTSPWMFLFQEQVCTTRIMQPPASPEFVPSMLAFITVTSGQQHMQICCNEMWAVNSNALLNHRKGQGKCTGFGSIDTSRTYLRFFRFTRPGRPPPKGLLIAKSMCFWLSTRTMKLGTFTICLPTLHHRPASTRPAF